MNLRAALANIHRDPFWWRKVLIGGALALTVIGAPWPAGLVVESLDNARKGYPTPLPPWYDWGTRYLIGFFALLIDFVFFVLPALAIGLLFICGGVAAAISSAGGWLRTLGAIAGAVLALYELTIFGLSIAPVGRLIYIEQGRAEEALSAHTLREALRPGARLVYAQTRLRSLPAYLPVLLFGSALAFVANQHFPFAWLAVLLLLWLTLSALVYAHLAVAQLYAAAARTLEASRGTRGEV